MLVGRTRYSLWRPKQPLQVQRTVIRRPASTQELPIRKQKPILLWIGLGTTAGICIFFYLQWSARKNILTEYLEEAMELESKGFYEDALPVFDEAMKVNRRNPVVPFHKGTVLAELQRYREALECYDKAILLDKRRASIHHRRAEALYHLERYDEAQEAVERCLHLEGEKYKPIYDNMVATITEAKAKKQKIKEQTS